MSTLGELGEEAVVERLCAGLHQPGRVLVGPGDDCAVIDTGNVLTLLKTDAVVEGVHFLPEAAAEKVGWKAVARVLSDFAAMGGRGRELVVTVALSREKPMMWLEALYRGMEQCASEFETAIVGGETTAVPEGSAAVISVAGRGEVERTYLTLRSGGSPGDLLYVTGRLGGSLAGKHLCFVPRVREAAWLVQIVKPTAMMDLSDGLARDLPRLARLSECGYALTEESIPCTPGYDLNAALSDGEDFELLLAVPSEKGEWLEKKWQAHFSDLELSCVGHLTESGGQLSGGYEHFQ